MDELVNYVTETPENTNPNVVRSLASQITTSGNSGILIVNVLYDYSTTKYTLDRTFREIAEAIKTGPIIIYGVDAHSDYDVSVSTNEVTSVYYDESVYIVQCDSVDYGEFLTIDLDGYPQTESDGK